MELRTPLTFRYMLGGAEPVHLYAHTCQQALEVAAQSPAVRAVIGKNAAPRFDDLQVLSTGAEWNWVLPETSTTSPDVLQQIREAFARPIGA